MRKSLKQLGKELVAFAGELSFNNIRYKIGTDCLMIPYRMGTKKYDSLIYVQWRVLPYNVVLDGDPQVFCIWPQERGGLIYFDKSQAAINFMVRVLKQAKAWQKNGVNYR